ncbi:MAG: hypothetical protein G4V63_21340 [Candidatus Afipia apatlaquensis]|uniref:DUF4145 domain-containing protein n=1 Tax=Candidatus Afipia apatlaquensis TaxID=2712852 RepID=A0A7C9VQG6_9BRAD|nr:hypothetical protein [Candidatus Afipia apatlaquensis]
MNAALRSLLSKRRGAGIAFQTIDNFESGKSSKNDDRGIILVSVALFEQLLEDAILIRCLKSFEKGALRDSLFSGNPEAGGAVSSLAGKIILGHALRLYGPQAKEDFDRLRRIRNVAAHSKARLTFNSPAIKDAVASFNLLSGGKFEGPRTKTAKGKFLTTCGVSMIFLSVIKTRMRRMRTYRPRLGPKNAFFYD